MYNQGNMRLHVDLFIKYVSNNVYSDNNLGQPQSILNIFLTFFSSLYFMTTFFLLGGMKMSGSAGLFSKQKIFFYLVGSPKVGGAGDGKHKQKYGHPYRRTLVGAATKQMCNILLYDLATTKGWTCGPKYIITKLRRSSQYLYQSTDCH